MFDALHDEARRSMVASTHTQQASALPLVADKSLITIDEESGVPIWMQLRNRLVYLVVSGTFPAGAKLPTVRDLSSTLQVNYNTVSKVYRDIEKDGYVITRRGKGTFVAEINSDGYEAADAKAAIDLLIDKFFEQCKELGLNEADAAEAVAKRAGGMFV